jgi:hypothetical protein
MAAQALSAAEKIFAVVQEHYQAQGEAEILAPEAT